MRTRHRPEREQHLARPTLQSAARTLRVLSLLMQSHQTLHVNEVASTLSLPYVTAYRLLKALTASGYAQQQGKRGPYMLTRLFRLSCRTVDATLDPAVDAAQEALVKLAQTAGATVSIMMPDELGRCTFPFVSQLPSTPVQVQPSASEHAPLHATAGGKCYLAHLPTSKQEAYLRRRLSAKTPHTVTSVTALRKELTQVRQRGFAENHQECVEGTVGLAVPLTGAGGEVVAALSLAYVGTELQPEWIARDLPQLQANARVLPGLLWPRAGEESAPSPEEGEPLRR